MRIKRGIGVRDVPRIRRDLKDFVWGGYEYELLGCPVEIISTEKESSRVYVKFLEGKLVGTVYAMESNELNYYED